MIGQARPDLVFSCADIDRPGTTWFRNRKPGVPFRRVAGQEVFLVLAAAYQAPHGPAGFPEVVGILPSPWVLAIPVEA